MSDVGRLGEMLHAEHLRTLSAMNELETRILGGARSVPIDGGNPEDARLVAMLLSVLEADIDRHFRFEEEDLFPLLAGRGLGDLTAALVQEHAAVRPLAETVTGLLEQARGGPLTGPAWEDFRNAAMDLIHSVLFHIQKEEMGLIRRLGFLLRDETDQRLAAAYAARGA